ncbi:lysostaphin resistance A-like protein [Microbacterium sp. B2969]|uniref:Lysostaphin resistance A-like protein n=1 Tax=Microbacterium alkaliflavum TaxID=3248839 RepID=A0ABW7Q5X3_9MICO
MTDTSTPATENGWRRFWNRGGWWRALLVVAVYYALYELVPLWTLGPFVQGIKDPAAQIWVYQTIPIAFGAVLLVLFALSLGWLRELFGKQPIRGSWWMWIAVGVVLLFNVLHFLAIDYSKAGPSFVIAWLISGLFIGFAEETLTRGYVVNLMRKAGYGEFVVAVVSAALFAAMHMGNVFGGAPVAQAALQVVYTFAFGICMYLTLRVTGNLIWPILLHASTDPSIYLMTGFPADGVAAQLAGPGNIVVIVVGLILMIFIRGRVNPKTSELPEPSIQAA